MNDFFPRCQHLTLSGARCTAPALRNKEFCYDHHYRRLRRARSLQPVLPGTRDIAGPLVTFVYMEDHACILENLNAIAFAFAEHSIDHRQASSMTYLMNTALKTLDRMRRMQKVRPEDMPTVVAHDELDDPIAVPDPAGDRSRETGDKEPQPTPFAADHQPTATPDDCHPESTSAGEEPGLSKSAQPASRMAPEPSAVPSPDCREETLATLTAAAEPNPERSHNSRRYKYIDTNLTATAAFSITCTSTPFATPPDSILAPNSGGTPHGFISSCEVNLAPGKKD
jgi:hypothetical protein